MIWLDKTEEQRKKTMLIKEHRIKSKCTYFVDQFGGGARIWTVDLRVMSPTSYQTALPRDVFASKFFLERSRLTSIAG